MFERAFGNAVDLAPAVGFARGHERGIALDARGFGDVVFRTPVVLLLHLTVQCGELGQAPTVVVSPPSHRTGPDEDEERRNRTGDKAEHRTGATPWAGSIGAARRLADRRFQHGVFAHDSDPFVNAMKLRTALAAGNERCAAEGWQLLAMGKPRGYAPLLSCGRRAENAS